MKPGILGRISTYGKGILGETAKNKNTGLPAGQTNIFLSTSLRIFGGIYRKYPAFRSLEVELKKSKLAMTRVQYLSLCSLYSIFFMIAESIVAVLAYILTGFYPALIFISALLVFVLWCLSLLYYPTSISHSRKKDIDAKLPMAIGYISSMASADIPIDRILSDLGKLDLYGEISKEANSITVMTDLFGMDILEAIKEASRFSPSRKFSEFLSGIGTTVNSGGNLRNYLIGKARQYNSELTIGIKRNVESIGVLAESFITVGVAFPLMLMIIVGVIAVLAPSPPLNLVLFLIFIVAFIIPVITAVFTIFIRSTLREVEF